MKTVVVVLTFNGAADTVRCLESLASSNAADFQIIVVDNGSTDNSVAVVRNWIDARSPGGPQCELVVSSTNTGFAAGNNLGISHAMQSEPTYIWLLNNDTVVTPDALQHLVSAADAHMSAGIVGACVVDIQPPHRIQYVGGGLFSPLLTRSKYVGRGQSLEMAVHSVTPVDYVGGASLFCRAEALRRTAGLNEAYFLYFEELDLARRLNRAGYSLHTEPQAVVYHHSGASSGGSLRHSKATSRSATSLFHANRSCIIFLRRWYWALLPIALTVRLLNAIFIFRSSPTLAGTAVRGLASGLVAPKERLPPLLLNS